MVQVLEKFHDLMVEGGHVQGNPSAYLMRMLRNRYRGTSLIRNSPPP